MRKLMILVAFLLSFSIAFGACHFPYKEGIDSCNPENGKVENYVRYVRIEHYYQSPSPYVCYPIEFYVTRVPYIAIQLTSLGGSCGAGIYVNDVYVGSIDCSKSSYWVIDMTPCDTATCRVTSGCTYSGERFRIEAVYILDEDTAHLIMKNVQFIHYDLNSVNDPYTVYSYGGMVTDVIKTYSDGVAKYEARSSSYPFTGYFTLKTEFSSGFESIFFLNPGSITGGTVGYVDIGGRTYDGRDDVLTVYCTSDNKIRVVRYIDYQPVKDFIYSYSCMNKYTAFWVDKKRRLAGIGDAIVKGSNIFGISNYVLISHEFFPDIIDRYVLNVKGTNTNSLYYSTPVFKYDVGRISIDLYIPEQFYSVRSPTYTLYSTTYGVAYIGEKLTGVNGTIYSFAVKSSLNLNYRKAYIYSPSLGILANATIVDNIAVFNREVTLNPLYEYYIIVEWNVSSYPVFYGTDYNDNTKFIYCYSLTNCVETTEYDFPVVVNEVFPVGYLTVIKARISNGVPPFHVCSNGTINDEPFSYCFDYVEREMDFFTLAPSEPMTVTLKANVTDSNGDFGESGEVVIRYAYTPLVINDVIVNYEGKDYHYYQYIEINTTSEELLSGKQFIFWVKNVVGGEAPYYTTLVCGDYNATKTAPATITLGIEVSGDISLSYEEFNAMSVNHPLYENATHYAKFFQCVFVTRGGAYALTGPTVNIYNFIPKVPITPINISLDLDKTVVSVGELVKALVSVEGGTPPYKVEVYELIYNYDICKWVTYSGTTQIDLYFSYPCSYSICERTYYLIASVTDSLGAGATSSIKSLIVNATYNATLPETIYNPNCPGMVGANITPGLPGVSPPTPPGVVPSYAEGVFGLTDIAMQLNITGPALVGIMIVDKILSLAGIATIITILFAVIVGYFTKSGLASAVTILLSVLLFTILGFYPWWLGIVFIIVAGFIIATMLKGVF